MFLLQPKEVENSSLQTFEPFAWRMFAAGIMAGKAKIKKK